MSKLALYYPQIRIAVYGLIAVGLTVAGIFGYVTEDQTTKILSTVTSILGIVGLIFAASNVKTAAPAIDAPALASEVAAQINTSRQVYGQVQRQAADSVADIRRRAEQTFGEFRR